MASRRLVIAQSSTVDENVSADIAIDDIYYGLNNEQIDEVFDTIRKFDVPEVAGLPMFDLLWPRLAGSFNAYHHAPTGLSNVILLYDQLDDRIDWERTDVLDCQGLDPFHRALVHDVADGRDVTVESEGLPSRPRLSGFLRGFVSLFLFLIDGIVSYVLGLFVGKDDDGPVVFVPHLNRLQSMLPVIDAATYPYSIIAPVATLDWYKSGFDGRWTGAHELDVIPLGRYVTLRVLSREWWCALRLGYEEGIRGRFQREVRSAVEAEFGANIPRTIDQSLGNTYLLHLSGLLYLHRARRMIRETGVDRVIVGSQSTRQQCILLAADEHSVRTFHVPHTVPLPQEALPHTDTVQIVPSKSSKEYLERATGTPDSLEIAALGRPPLVELSESAQPNADIEEPISILVATQPYDDKIRREFVETVLTGLRGNEMAARVSIKIHPNETRAFYGRYAATRDIEVSVTDQDLIEEIRNADLTVVISTNVGIESLALGTPVVSINYWSPRIRQRPYQRNSPIPVLDGRDEAINWFASLSTAEVAELRESEWDFFQRDYLRHDDAPARIADYVVSDDL